MAWIIIGAVAWLLAAGCILALLYAHGEREAELGDPRW